jgi:hypothetical protein
MVFMGDESSCIHLLSRARRGDRDAEGQLLELFRAYLKILARLQIDRTLQGKADASDLVRSPAVHATCRSHSARFAEWAGTPWRIAASRSETRTPHCAPTTP